MDAPTSAAQPSITSLQPAAPAKKRRGLKPGQSSGNCTLSPTDDPGNLRPYIQAAVRIVTGEPVRATAMTTGLVREQGGRVGEICGLQIEDFREQVRLKTQKVLELLTERLPTIVADLKPMESFVAYGITMDKYRDLTGGNAPTVVHNTAIQINGMDRKSALAAITGPHGAMNAGKTGEPNFTRTIPNANTFRDNVLPISATVTQNDANPTDKRTSSDAAAQ